MNVYAWVYLIGGVVASRIIYRAWKTFMADEFPPQKWDAMDEAVCCTETLCCTIVWPIIVLGLILRKFWTWTPKPHTDDTRAPQG